MSQSKRRSQFHSLNVNANNFSNSFFFVSRFNSSVHEKSLLVMENLFYECEIANKFDLKGSDRNRLVDPTNQNGEIVLLDENLIQSKDVLVQTNQL